MSKCVMVCLDDQGIPKRVIMKTLSALEIDYDYDGDISGTQLVWLSGTNNDVLPNVSKHVFQDLLDILMVGKDMTAIVYADNVVHHVFSGLVRPKYLPSIARQYWKTDHDEKERNSNGDKA